MTIEQRRFVKTPETPSFSIVSEIKKQVPEFPNIHPQELAKALNINIEIIENLPTESKGDKKPIGLLVHQDQKTTVFLKEDHNAIQKKINTARSIFYFLHFQQQFPNQNFSSEIYSLDSTFSSPQQWIWDHETIEEYLLHPKIVEKVYKDKKQNDLKGVITQMSEHFLLPTDMIKTRLCQLQLITLQESLVIKESPSIIDMCQVREIQT